jgi:hypothetical protein
MLDNFVHGEGYSIKHYVIKFVSDNWNIVESGTQHHKLTLTLIFAMKLMRWEIKSNAV